jgi:hypothetical protein
MGFGAAISHVGDLQPHDWGTYLWRFNVAPAQPHVSHDPMDYDGFVRLARLHAEQPTAPVFGSDIRSWVVVGDSDYEVGNLPELRTELDDSLRIITPLENASRRLAGFELQLKNIRSTNEAYRAVISGITFINLRATMVNEVPLRVAGIILKRPADNLEVSIVPAEFPVQPMLFVSELPPFLLSLGARYAEGVRSGSPMYSFLTYYELNKVLGWLQTVLRPFADEKGIVYVDLNGKIPVSRSTHVRNNFSGKRYREVLTMLYSHRNEISHELLGKGVKPFVSGAEDLIMLERDVLRIMAFDLLGKLMINVSEFEEAGVTPMELDAHINAEYEVRKASKRRGKRGHKAGKSRVNDQP